MITHGASTYTVSPSKRPEDAIFAACQLGGSGRVTTLLQIANALRFSGHRGHHPHHHQLPMHCHQASLHVSRHRMLYLVHLYFVRRLRI